MIFCSFIKVEQRGRRILAKLFVLLQYDVFNIYIFLLQQLDSIHVTILHKEEGAGLGFSLAGGADLENKVITVSGPVMGFIRARGNDPWRGEHLSGGGSEECITPGLGREVTAGV